MTQLYLIGIGPGHARFLTQQAIETMAQCDTIVIPRKGRSKDDLAELRRRICADYAPDVPLREFDLPQRSDKGIYLENVRKWHDAIAEAWAKELAAAPGEKVGFLVWGDPSLYDSTLRIASRLPDIAVRVIPGITAIQALTASHGIALNSLGAPVTITTGRQLRDHGWPDGADTIVVMLDSGGAFTTLDPTGLSIFWSAYAGMDQEISLSGALSDLSDTIVQTRAAARERHGWIMDIYLIRKT